VPSVVAIIKDEGPYLAEWVAFHELQGFKRFLIYDNGSCDDGPAVAEAMGCEVMWWPGEVQQLPAYYDALTRLDGGDWAAFIDVDEYLWCPNGSRVVDELVGDAVGAPWRMFGTSGHQQRPSGLTISSYRRCAPHAHHEVKQILRPGLVTVWADPHHTDLPYLRSETVVCNHYWTRSEEECAAKFARGRADTIERRSMHEFYEVRDTLNATEEDGIARLWATALERRLEARAHQKICTDP
jgi:hypothetical protein